MCVVCVKHMLLNLLDQVCEHIDLPGWNKLARTSKHVLQVIDTPLYWDARFGLFKKEMIEKRGHLDMYRSNVCHCIVGPFAPKQLSCVYVISLPVQTNVSTKMFVRHMAEEMRYLNHDFLPQLSTSLYYESRVIVRMEKSYPPEGFVLAGQIRVAPVFFEGDAANEEDVENSIYDLIDSVFQDENNNSRRALEEVVEELQPDETQPQAPEGGCCPDCGREFDDDGFGNVILVGYL
jgi:hypothetical protein